MISLLLLAVLSDVRPLTREQIAENARAVIDAVIKAKPHSAKGAYLRSCTLSATMSPPLGLDVREFLAAA